MKTVPIAKALILDANGHILMLRRSDTHPTLAGRRDLPGGLIDEGEEPGEAVIREISEETGLHIQKTQLQLLYSSTEIHDDENRVRFLYIARVEDVKPAVTISWEHSSADWVELDDLASIEKDFHSFYHDALHHIRVHNLVST